MELPDKDDALAALRTWQDWRNRRDDLIRAARRAGASITEIISASGCAKGTVTTALTHADQKEPPHMDVTEAARQYHHPKFSSAVPADGDSSRLVFRFTPSFSHWEQEPVTPSYWEDSGLTREDKDFLSLEWEAAHAAYWQSVFRYSVRSLIGDAGDRRNAYLAARQAMDDAYTALQAATDGQWRALLLAMAAAHVDALAAAQAWDGAAAALARAQRDHWQHTGRDAGLTLAAVASESGYAISEWDIQEVSYAYDPYKGSRADCEGPATGEVRSLIERQRKLLKAAGEMAGDRN